MFVAPVRIPPLPPAPVAKASQREKLEGGTLPGQIFSRRFALIRDLGGDDAVAAVRALLSPDARDHPPQFYGTYGRFPFRWLVEVDRAIERVLGAVRPNVLDELGRLSARRLREQKNFIGAKSPHDFLLYSANHFTKYQDFGAALYEKISETSARFSVVQPTCYSIVYCASMRTYYEECLLLSGARGAKVIETSCVCLKDDNCVYLCSWE